MGNDNCELNFNEQGIEAICSSYGEDFIASQLARNPSNPHAWLMSAHLRLVHGDLLGAWDAIENVLRFDARHEFNKRALGGLYYSLAIKAGHTGDWALLLDFAKRSDELGFTYSMTPSQEATLLFQKARAFVIQQNYQEAISALETTTTIDQYHSDAFTLLGHAHYQAGEWLAAREAYVRALRCASCDPLIAQFLDIIDYYFPPDLEKVLPQRLDPYVRAAISYVEDRWLALSLEGISPGERKAFGESLLQQVCAQSGEIRWGGRDIILLRVPVRKLSGAWARVILGEETAPNVTRERYRSAIQEVLDYFMEIQAKVQERACTLDASIVHKIKAGRRLLAVTFHPFKAPHFTARLHFTFEEHRKRGGVASPDSGKSARLRGKAWKNAFEFIFKNERHSVTFEDAHTYFALDETGHKRLPSLADVCVHFMTGDGLYFIHQMSPGKISSSKLVMGAEFLSVIRQGGRLRGVRIVLGANTGIKGRARFYAILFASFDEEPARSFVVNLAPSIISLEGMPEKKEGKQ